VTVVSYSRILPIEGTFNFRDLGGYPTLDGRRTRWRTMYRADALHRLSPAGVQSVVQLGVRSVVDLRYPAECEQSPCMLGIDTQIEIQPIPLFENPQRPADGSVPELDTIYRVIVDTRQSQLVAVLEALASADSLPSVVNCTAGKDRTGVVIAVLLSVLGVEQKAIAADYAMSGPLLLESPVGEEVRTRIAERGGDPLLANRLLVSPPEYMERLLSYVDETYGGAEALVTRAGLSAQHIASLREALLE